MISLHKLQKIWTDFTLSSTLYASNSFSKKEVQSISVKFHWRKSVLTSKPVLCKQVKIEL